MRVIRLRSAGLAVFLAALVLLFALPTLLLTRRGGWTRGYPAGAAPGGVPLPQWAGRAGRGVGSLLRQSDQAALLWPKTGTGEGVVGQTNDSQGGGRRRRRHFLSIVPRGRLGNQMFQYASLLGIADLNDRTPFVSSSCRVAHYFANVSVSDRPVSQWRWVEESGYAIRDPALASLPPEDIRLKGFFQSWKYFAAVASTVKRSFAFAEDVKEVVQAFYANSTRGLGGADVVRIGVHVRRTDMLQKLTQKQGYVSAPLSYIRKAVDHMRARFGNASTFFVVSDDADWCRRNLEGKGVRVVDSAPSVVHLGFLALCDHVIMTVGTFGWWGAYLSGGHVVYYDGYPREGSEISRGFSREDFYLPQWVPLGA